MTPINDSTTAGQVAARRAAVDKLRHDGLEPYVASITVPCHPSVVLRGNVEDLPELAQVQNGQHTTDQPHQVMGRLLQVNDMGRIIFAFIRSDGIELQLCATAIEAASLAALRNARLGDHVWAVGYPFRTRQGKRALLVREVRTVSPCLRPLPSKALQGENAGNDQRWRAANPEASMIITPQRTRVLRQRAAIVSAVRRTLDSRGFVEVETRSLLRQASGAAAKPFVTHCDDADASAYLRIATEVELKRLIVAGMERIYELGRVYRNESADRTHNPEFTTVELYQAGIDLHCMMLLVESIVQEAYSAAGTEPVTWHGHQVSIGHTSDREGYPVTYDRMTMREAVRTLSDLPHVPVQQACATVTWAEQVELTRYAHEHCGLPANVKYGDALQWIFDKHVVPHIVQPTFVTRHPISASPLSARCADDPELAERFELYCCGMEIANGCVELTDPDEQRQRLHVQGAIDEDLIRALEVGMPPTAGCGIGIDRLCMVLLGADDIADVMALPR